MPKFLEGYRTQILMVIGIVAAGLLQFGVITEDQYKGLMLILAPLGVMTLHAAVKRLGPSA